MELNEAVRHGQVMTDPADSPSSPVAAVSSPTAWARAVGIGIGLAMLIGVLVTAFAWPATESAPRDVPIAAVASAEATAQLEEQLATAVPGGFELRPVPDIEAARQLIYDREVYGALVLEPAGSPHVLTASAASPVVAQLIQGVAGRLAAQGSEGSAAPVEDVVPLPEADPRGSGFAAAALPMVIGGMIVGIATSFLVGGVWRRVGGAVAAALAAGVVVTVVTQVWLGVLDGHAWTNVGAIALTIAAMAMTLIGLVAMIGPRGIPIGAVAMFLLGNPLSGVASAPEMLPTGWGTLGQLLPPGAGGTLLRSTSFFDGAVVTGPILVLGTWLAVGLALAALGHRLRPGQHQALVT